MDVVVADVVVTEQPRQQSICLVINAARCLLLQPRQEHEIFARLNT